MEPFRPTFRTYLILAALWLMVFSASSQVMIVSPILPRIGESLDVAQALLGSLVSAYAVMLSLFALITGPISDRFGRRAVLLGGSAFMAFSLYLHGLADTYLSLLLLRAMAGAAGGMLSGAAVSFVGDYFPYHRRGWANGWVMSGIAFGQIVGIPTGTLLAERIGFRWPFLLFAIVMTLATLLIWRVVPQPQVERDPHPLSVGRAIRNYWLLMRNREAAAGTATYFLMFFSLGVYVIYLPTWLEDQLLVGGEAIASLFLVGGLANVISGPVSGRISDSVGRKPLIITSCIGLSLVMVVTTFVITSMWVAYVLFAVAMILVGMRISPLQSLMTALVTSERRGIFMSMAVGIGQLGVGIAGVVSGLLYSKLGYLSNTLTGAVAILMMAFMVRHLITEPALRPETERPDVPAEAPAADR